MIQRETAEPVIQYLRALTYNGELTSGEIWDLGNWLNQQPEKIQTSWPAKPLITALQAAFADNELTPAEMEDLAHTIVAIEQLWIESNHSTVEGAAADEILAQTASFEEGRPAAPAIPITAVIPNAGSSDTFTVDLQHHTCTCPEWTGGRAEYPEGDFRRCCAHLIQAFRGLNHESLPRDPLFAAFVDDHGRRNKGTEPDTIWHVIVINGSRVLYGASPASEWVKVFASDGETCKRFGYNRRKQRWAFGERPQDVSWQIASLFSQTQPQPQLLTSRPLTVPA